MPRNALCIQEKAGKHGFTHAKLDAQHSELHNRKVQQTLYDFPLSRKISQAHPKFSSICDCTSLLGVYRVEC
jgi:hypothetical protein